MSNYFTKSLSQQLCFYFSFTVSLVCWFYVFILLLLGRLNALKNRHVLLLLRVSCLWPYNCSILMYIEHFGQDRHSLLVLDIIIITIIDARSQRFLMQTMRTCVIVTNSNSGQVEVESGPNPAEQHNRIRLQQCINPFHGIYCFLLFNSVKNLQDVFQ